MFGNDIRYALRLMRQESRERGSDCVLTSRVDCQGSYAINPNDGAAKLPRFGNTSLRSPAETPNHEASVAAY